MSFCGCLGLGECGAYSSFISDTPRSGIIPWFSPSLFQVLPVLKHSHKKVIIQLIILKLLPAHNVLLEQTCNLQDTKTKFSHVDRKSNSSSIVFPSKCICCNLMVYKVNGRESCCLMSLISNCAAVRSRVSTKSKTSHPVTQCHVTALGAVHHWFTKTERRVSHPFVKKKAQGKMF